MISESSNRPGRLSLASLAKTQANLAPELRQPPRAQGPREPEQERRLLRQLGQPAARAHQRPPERAYGQGGNSIDFTNAPKNAPKVAPKLFMIRTCV